jgi:hypothetical protein
MLRIPHPGAPLTLDIDGITVLTVGPAGTFTGIAIHPAWHRAGLFSREMGRRLDGLIEPGHFDALTVAARKQIAACQQNTELQARPGSLLPDPKRLFQLVSASIGALPGRCASCPAPREGAGVLPGAGGRAVAAQDLGPVPVPRGGGPVGVADQGPAHPVNHH